MGEWYYPDSRAVQKYAFSTAAGEAFYRVRNAPQVIRLARRDRTRLEPTGRYCCVIPTTGGEETVCANIGKHLFGCVLLTVLLVVLILQLCVSPSLL